MFPRPKFFRTRRRRRRRARERFAVLGAGVGLGLLLAWLQESLGLDARVVRLVLLVSAAVLLFLSVLLLVAYVKELRRAEDEWAASDEEDAD